MRWVAIPTSWQDSLALVRLASKLGRDAALASCVRLWAWAIVHAPTGNLSSLSNDELAAIMQLTGNVPDPWATLEGAGVTDDGQLVGWEELNGWLLQRAEKERRRKREAYHAAVAVGEAASRAQLERARRSAASSAGRSVGRYTGKGAESPRRKQGRR